MGRDVDRSETALGVCLTRSVTVQVMNEYRYDLKAERWRTPALVEPLSAAGL